MIIHRLPAVQTSSKKRVAAYCRVSTRLESQEDSLDIQIKHYMRCICGREDWEWAGVYSDDGISGASVRKRPGFQRMLSDVLDKRIDIILVKSISRFSRNAAQCQHYVRLLRSMDVQVLFEEEGIDSMNPGSDLVFNIRAAFAQEESRMIGENVRWTYRRNFASGVYRIGNNRILGYDQCEDSLVPNQDAQIVRLIFRMFADGAGFADIRRALQSRGAKRLRSERDFDAETLKRMLKNELYAGDLHTMKTSRPQAFPDERCFWKNHHTPIVSRELWERAQKRLRVLEYTRGHHVFFGTMFCGTCGAAFKRRTIAQKGCASYKAWNCAERQKGKKGNGCRCRIIKEGEVEQYICRKLGWETFDAELYVKQVDRLFIGQERIDIRLIRDIDCPLQINAFSQAQE